MPVIKIRTKINAPKKTVFDLSINIAFHNQSTNSTNEFAIDGITTGLTNYNETVAWPGKYFGFNLTHKSKITAMIQNEYFVDEMVEGKFKSFRHKHHFEEKNGFTIMKDKVYYEVPYGSLGEVFDFLFLKNYLINFLLERNKMLKKLSENEQ
ncbi:SRPBCC family protein [Flavobacterium sp. 83]|jgi:ligand-binding SRPBCC domain-containing protein|uniref:SRPBCC family protein n=1 Tax=Flavobacterium sp. 83 TaxID=1131812 RepID=UPI0005574A7B|nr:SRPBCC family protein [Flavobacterium sp. 83]